jgi:hypothetical protein
MTMILFITNFHYTEGSVQDQTRLLYCPDRHLRCVTPRRCVTAAP